MPRLISTSAFSSLLQTLFGRGLALLVLASPICCASAAVINAALNTAAEVPVTSSGYTAGGNSVNLSLNFAPATGTQLMVVKNTGLDFIHGAFDNLAQGQEVELSFRGMNYHFVANYFGGSGNDLVLHWAGTQVYDWGFNSQGQLGNNTTWHSSPVPLAVFTTGVLAGKTVIAVSAGGYHSLALCSDGTVAAWGANPYGQLGNNSTINSPVPVAVLSSGALNGKTVVAIAAGGSHSLALCSDGTVAAWGNNAYGSLGNSSTTRSQVPVAVTIAGTALEGKTVVAISAGGHSLALCSDGTVVAWGYNYSGQLGNGNKQSSPVPVAVNTAATALAGKTVVAISAGSSHSLALCTDGTVAAWGYNGFGGLGNNSTNNSPVPVAVQVAGTAIAGKVVTAVAAGGTFNLALCSDGTVASWGSNDIGELGNQTTTPSHVPVAVSFANTVIAGKKVVAISCGDYHSLALCGDGTVVAWGRNANGELGNGQLGDSRFFAKPGAVNMSSLAAGTRVVFVLSGSTAQHSLMLAAPPLVSATLPKTAPVLNKYTGLYEWLVQVKNTSASAITGFDLFISDLPKSVSVQNGFMISGESFVAPSPLLGYQVHHGAPVGAGQSVTVVVEFFSTKRPMPKLNPKVTTSIVPSDDPPGKGQYGIPVSKVSKLANRGNLVQFRSVKGSRYRLWYSVPAAMANSLPNVTKTTGSDQGWLASPVPTIGNGSVIFWMDEGPPKTLFTPLDDPTRQYRVELLPGMLR